VVRRISSGGVCRLFSKDVWGCWRLKIQSWSKQFFGRQDELVVLVAERHEGRPVSSMGAFLEISGIAQV